MDKHSIDINLSHLAMWEEDEETPEEKEHCISSWDYTPYQIEPHDRMANIRVFQFSDDTGVFWNVEMVIHDSLSGDLSSGAFAVRHPDDVQEAAAMAATVIGHRAVVDGTYRQLETAYVQE